MKRCLLTLAVLLSSSVVFGGQQDYSGNTVLAQCKTALRAVDTDFVAKSAEISYCLGWINAATSGYELVHALMDKTHPCQAIPSGVTNEQIMQVFVKWMEDHPETLHEDPFVIFTRAMRAAFPPPVCEAPTKGKPRPTPSRQ